MGKEHSTVKKYIENIALNNGVSIDFYGDFDRRLKADKSKSIQESGTYEHFWNSLFHEFKDEIEKIKFLYQEKDKELPLSFGKNLARKLGFNVKPKTQEGEIKKEQLSPIMIRKNFPTLNVIISKEEWKLLNVLAKDSHGFSAPYVMMPEPLNHQVNIPLENIVEVKFKSYDFLNKSYNKN